MHSPLDPERDIAVVGMALRVPGAETLDRFWGNLLAGRDSLTRPSAQELRAMGVGSNNLSNPQFVAAKPLLNDIGRFDAAFFDIAAFEAERIDPGHRLFLECVWEALESGGVVPGREGPVAGVFAGVEGMYRMRNLEKQPSGRADTTANKSLRDPTSDLALRLGTTLDYFTARVSHKLDLVGPSFTLLAACATSLQAIHLGVQSLRQGECEVAIAGGATIEVPQIGGYLSGVEGMLSASGRLRPYDADADGTIFGNGVGVVVLKTLAAARADGNPIYAVIRGSAACNDGNPPGKESFIAPSPEGQVDAIAGALTDAGLSGDTVGLVEGHGTGTAIGDPIEVSSLTTVFRESTDARGYCALGSVKSNVGHLRMAAGVVSFIKACLALERRTLPPTAHFGNPNPRIDFEQSPFFVNADAREWQGGAYPRRAGVSAFGFGGSNVHVVLEEHPEAESAPSTRHSHLLTVSAPSETTLKRELQDLGTHFEEHPELSVADVAHTLQCGRKAWPHRACVRVDSHEPSPGRLFDGPAIITGTAKTDNRPTVFLFPGMGSQRPGMGEGLYRSEEVYRNTVDHCAELLEPELGIDIRSLIHRKEGAAEPHSPDDLLRTANAQPALFVVEYATARLFQTWGMEPTAMLGHSVGEIVAAAIAGVFSLPDAIRLVATRSRLMQKCPAGAMAAVFLPQAELKNRMPDELDIAALNAPFVTVVSGPIEIVKQFREALVNRGIESRNLYTSHAFHSRMMEPVLPEFRALMEELQLSPPKIPVISNGSGIPMTPEEATDPGYWSDHVRNAVNFAAGVEHLLSDTNPIFLELGPGTTLIDLVGQQDADAARFAALDDGSGKAPLDSREFSLAALGGAWSAGAGVDWRKYYAGESRHKVALPTYPFQRYRHWVEPDGGDSEVPLAEEIYERGWREAPIDSEVPEAADGPWLIFCDECGLADALIEQLVNEDREYVAVSVGKSLERTGPNRFQARPGSKDDLNTVLEEVSAIGGGKAPNVLHLWSVTDENETHDTADAFRRASLLGFHTLIALTQEAYKRAMCEEMNVLVVANGIACLDDEPGLEHTEKGTLLGPCLTIPIEIKGMSIRCLDIPSIGGEDVASWVTESILREAGVSEKRGLTALRSNGRFVEDFLIASELPLNRPRLRDGGAVFITGGTGGLGLQFAEALYDEARARIALTSRWAPPPKSEWPERSQQDDKIGQILKRVMALEERGAEVWIWKSDSPRKKQESALNSTQDQTAPLASGN